MEKLAKKYIENGNNDILFDYADISFVGEKENKIFSDEYARKALKERGLYSSYIEDVRAQAYDEVWAIVRKLKSNPNNF